MPIIPADKFGPIIMALRASVGFSLCCASAKFTVTIHRHDMQCQRCSTVAVAATEGMRRIPPGTHPPHDGSEGQGGLELTKAMILDRMRLQVGSPFARPRDHPAAGRAAVSLFRVADSAQVPSPGPAAAVGSGSGRPAIRQPPGTELEAQGIILPVVAASDLRAK